MSEERDALLARQLLAQLDGQPLPDTDEEVRALAAFAQGRDWPAARPDASFQLRLRRKLVQPAAAARPARFRLPHWGYAAAAAVIVVVVVGVLLGLGPRVRPIFGTIYNSLGPTEQNGELPYWSWYDGRGVRLAYDLPAGATAAPVLETVAAAPTQQAVYATQPPLPAPTMLPGATPTAMPGGDVGPGYPAPPPA
jgi:hypothetical protein